MTDLYTLGDSNDSSDGAGPAHEAVPEECVLSTSVAELERVGAAAAGRCMSCMLFDGGGDSWSIGCVG